MTHLLSQLALAAAVTAVTLLAFSILGAIADAFDPDQQCVNRHAKQMRALRKARR